MQSHRGMDHEEGKRLREMFISKLEDKAQKMTAAGESQLPGGKQEEQPLTEYTAENGVGVRRMPEDEMGIIRISAGGGDNTPVVCNYVVFRGNAKQTVKLLHKVIAAIEQGF